MGKCVTNVLVSNAMENLLLSFVGVSLVCSIIVSIAGLLYIQCQVGRTTGHFWKILAIKLDSTSSWHIIFKTFPFHPIFYWLYYYCSINPSIDFLLIYILISERPWLLLPVFLSFFLYLYFQVYILMYCYYSFLLTLLLYFINGLVRRMRT